MEELDEFDVLWPDAAAAHGLPATGASSPVTTSDVVKPSESPTPRSCGFSGSARSRPVDVPRAAAPARLHRWKDGDDDDGAEVIVPPHLLLRGRRRPESAEATATAWTLRASPGPPCKRARELRHLRHSVLRMTGFIEG
ncbi:hypothetical protein ACP4OV_020193 [Aristida adscensionis]